MGFDQTVQSMVDILGSAQGTVSMGLAALVAIGTPVARFLIRRKRVVYRVLCNSRIGLNPIDFDADDVDAVSEMVPGPANEGMGHLARLLSQVSVVIIRFRNRGLVDIDPADIKPAISLSFGDREIWDARISESSSPQLRQQLKANLQFVTNPDSAVSTKSAGEARTLPTLRRGLWTRLATALNPGATNVAVSPASSAPPRLHGVRLVDLSMRRRESFKLVVVLSEPTGSDGEISKELAIDGGHAHASTIVEEEKQRRWPAVVGGVGVLLVGALLATLIMNNKIVPGSSCPSGSVKLEGSSAFGPIAANVAAN